jgi:hypothetical protein
MTIQLTEKTLELLNQVNIVQQLIVEIDGLPIFGSFQVGKYWKIGEAGLTIGMAGLKVGGTIAYPNQKAYITINGSTTKEISQDIDLDKNTGSTVTNINIELVDNNAEITNIFQTANLVSEVIGKNAKVYLGFQGAGHPDDSILLLSGILDSINYQSASIQLTISQASQIARGDLFIKATTKLSAAIDSSVTTLPVYHTGNFYLPTDIVTAYVKIEDEIIEINTRTSTSFTSVTRGALGTTAAEHDIDSQAESLYEISGDIFDVILKLLCSYGDPYQSSTTVSNFEATTNKIFLSNVVFISENSLVEGDFVKVLGATNAGNNILDVEILQIDTLENSIVVDSALVEEIVTSAVLYIKTKYDTLDDGCGLDGRFVDIQRFEELKETFAFSYPQIDIFLSDTINAKEFIETNILFPCGLYSIPRKGKMSVGITTAPLPIETVVEIDKTNVVTASRIILKRSITKYYFNTVIYKFNKSIFTDRYQDGLIVENETSIERFNIGAKSRVIEADHFDATANTFFNSQAARYLARYEYIAESFDVNILYKKGLTIEIGDIVLFNGNDLNVANTKDGTRTYGSKLLEVINKRLNFATGEINLTLLDTAYAPTDRYGLIAPSSIIDSATSTVLTFIRSSTLKSYLGENSKWKDLVGEKIIVHSPDYATIYYGTIVSMSTSNYNQITVTNLGATPVSGMMIDLDNYDDVVLPKTKLLYSFLSDGTNNFADDGSPYLIL